MSTQTTAALVAANRGRLAVRVLADGSGLAADGAFPSDLTRRRWQQLRSREVPGIDYAVDYELMRLATAQIEHLQSYSAGVTYELFLDGRNVATVEEQLGSSGRGTGKRFAEQLARVTGIGT